MRVLENLLKQTRPVPRLDTGLVFHIKYMFFDYGDGTAVGLPQCHRLAVARQLCLAEPGAQPTQPTNWSIEWSCVAFVLRTPAPHNSFDAASSPTRPPSLAPAAQRGAKVNERLGSTTANAVRWGGDRQPHIDHDRMII